MDRGLCCPSQVISPSLAWGPAGGHLHDNAVRVELGLGDLDGSGVGRHVDDLGFGFFCDV